MKNARLKDNVTGETFNLTSLLEKNGVVVIGRREKGHERKSTADILLGEGSEVVKGSNLERTLKVILRHVSREHAIITYNGHEEKFYLCDSSKNGTVVGDKLLIKDERTYLENGDKIYFGGNAYGPVVYTEDDLGQDDILISRLEDLEVLTI